MKIRLLVVVFLIAGPAFADRGYVIGNGGDGYDVGGRLFVTDLLEAGLEGEALPAPSPESEPIARRLRALRWPVPVPADGLAAQLARLDRGFPGFSEIVLLVLREYQWRAVSVPLGRVPDLEGRTIGLPEASRVQIANRLSKDIRLQTGAWNRLDDANRVALILHEVFYSLLKTDAYEERESEARTDLMIQSSRKARELVGVAFHPEGAARFAKLAPAWLSIPSNPWVADARAPEWRVDLTGRNGQTRPLGFLRIGDAASVAQLESFIGGLCEEALRDPSVTALQSSLSQPLLSGWDDVYPSPFGPQVAFIVDRDLRAVFSHRTALGGGPECRASLRLVLDKIVASGWVSGNR